MNHIAFIKNQYVEVWHDGGWITGQVKTVQRDSQYQLISYRVETVYGVGIYWPVEVRKGQEVAA